MLEAVDHMGTSCWSMVFAAVMLSHSCLEILTSVVWNCHTFGNNFGLKHLFANYLKESCRSRINKQLSIKYFPAIAFVGEISPRKSDGFCCYRHEWVVVVYHKNMFIKWQFHSSPDGQQYSRCFHYIAYALTQ